MIVDISEAADVLQERHDQVRRAYGSAIGKHRFDLVTPALILDLPAARRNITKMAERMRDVPADLRPHVKVHKSPELARLQVESGAIGVSTATVWEAIVMVRSGLDGVFVVNTVAGPEKVAASPPLHAKRTSWSPWTTPRIVPRSPPRLRPRAASSASWSNSTRVWIVPEWTPRTRR